MEELNEVIFQRCLCVDDAVELPMLSIFADVSKEAFGACAYLRWRRKEDKIEVRFIAAKSIVAPLKQLTIPRLELQAVLINQDNSR